MNYLNMDGYLHQTYECTGQYYDAFLNTWFPTYGRVNCAKCGGSGSHNCPKCNGDGRIKKSY